jgi:hypothetical protein
MTGIVLWDDSGHNTTDSIQLEYRYVGFDFIATGEGQYDWSSFETLLDEISGRGHQALIRFYFL